MGGGAAVGGKGQGISVTERRWWQGRLGCLPGEGACRLDAEMTQFAGGRLGQCRCEQQLQKGRERA